MDSIKRNVKRIWNSKCKYLVIVACALILMNGVNLLQTSLKFINSEGVEVEEKKSVVITSSDWESKGPGSFKVTKSANWTGLKKATIRFDVETNGLTGHSERDIILVLDNSGSMGAKVNGMQKLGQLQSDATELINFLLTEQGTRIAVINFNSNASLLSGFTSNQKELASVINSLKPAGGTNYRNAYQAVIDLLSGYEEAKDRDLVMLFLTDGGAQAASAEYQILKDNYHIQICGIQYELGSTIKKSIIESSDVQYAANTINLKSIFFESIGVESYEEFEITDYISKEFEVENISDIRVSRGNVRIEKDSSGKQKVIWTLPTSEVKFITSFSATMTIDVIYKGELEPDKVIKTNDKEIVKVDLPDPTPTPGPEKIETEDTPEIRGGYFINYDLNLPSGCTIEEKDYPTRNSYFAYDVAEISKDKYTCSGWQFKGWKLPVGITLIGDDKFIMPSEDITVTATWTKLDIDKKMEGTISRPIEELKVLMVENAGTTVSVDTGIKFGLPSSETNGRGLYIRKGTESDTNPIYYYRGNVDNNYVLFAGICWQIVRTTESGGIKLIYNGVSSDGKTCNTTGDNRVTTTSISTSSYNVDTKLVQETIGYMYGQPIKYRCTSSVGSSIRLAPTFTINNNGYAALENSALNAVSGSNYHYRCAYSNRTTCNESGYSYLQFYFWYEGKDKPACFIDVDKLTIDEYMDKVLENTNNSSAKSSIDSWYKTNIVDKGYAKYVDNNSVWCNDRYMIDGPLNGSFGHGETHFASTEWRRLNTASAAPEVRELYACNTVRDRFTTSSANTGNHALKYPVGMLTADEVVLGGLSFTTASQDSYLSSNSSYWTMTPYTLAGRISDSIYSDRIVLIYLVRNGKLDKENGNYSIGIRPSISLKPGTFVYGRGTKDDPYGVVME